MIKLYGGKFYMIKHSEFYGFFLITPKGAYVCAGGNIRNAAKNRDIQYFDENFLHMVKKYIQIFSPYRHAQEQIAEEVKAFGGEGWIHGCIIDIDFCNHIMLNSGDGSCTYYYSPVFGHLKPYPNLTALLEAHNEELAVRYKKQLGTADNSLVPQSQIDVLPEMIKIDIKNSPYAVSRKMNQIQRLFDNKILRDWNDRLLDDGGDVRELLT